MDQEKKAFLEVDRKRAIREIEMAYRALDRALAHLVFLKEAYESQGHKKHGEYLQKVAELIYHVEQLVLDFRRFM